jgi:electron transfer flavoprotein beta subunit
MESAMKVVVLLKPVPDTSGDEAFEADFSLDRASLQPVINPNDEYALEAALRFADQTADVEIATLSMAPAEAWPALSKGLAVGAREAIMVSDDTLAGSCVVGTANVLAAALRKRGFDLVVAGTDTPDGRAGVVCASVAALLGIPFIAHAGSFEVREGAIVVQRSRDDGHETLEATLPALVSVTQQIGELRYPNLRGIMASRTRRPLTWGVADVALDGAIAGAATATTAVLEVVPSAPRSGGRLVKGDTEQVVSEIVSFLVERRLVP